MFGLFGIKQRFKYYHRKKSRKMNVTWHCIVDYVLSEYKDYVCFNEFTLSGVSWCVVGTCCLDHSQAIYPQK